jgi:dolichol-phosphate mannosyltransferase
MTLKTDKTHLVIIPTYNEALTIERILKAVLDQGEHFQVLVIDDGSPDKTAQIVKEIAASLPNRVMLIERSHKMGIGTAYITGFKWALSQGKDFVYEMDADFSHPPQELNTMAQILESGQADLVIGSRYIDGVRVINWPMNRLLLSYFASVYARKVTGLPIWDTTAGFMGYNAQVLESLQLNKIQFKGYVFQIAMKYLAWKNKAKLKEIPITFYERQEGFTKLSSSIIWEAIFSVLLLPFRYKRYLS